MTATGWERLDSTDANADFCALRSHLSLGQLEVDRAAHKDVPKRALATTGERGAA